MQTPGWRPGECGSHDPKSGNRETKHALKVLQVPPRLTLALLGGGSRVRVTVHACGDEPSSIVIPMAQVPNLLRAFVYAEVGA